MPDFVCIGAPRSGTTWLFERLSEHPDFWLPPVKEVHYFDRDPGYPSPNTLAVTEFAARLRQPVWLLNALLSSAFAFCYKGPSAARWLSKWYFSDFNDDWYLSLFEGVDAITGEITPAYSILTPEDIARMHALLPAAKIIYLLRNPVERSWSSYRKEYLRRGDRLDVEGILEFLASSTIAKRSGYISTIDQYAAHFGHENVLISTYDALKSHPVRMLLPIVSFLGGRPELVERYCRIDNVSNASPDAEMPKPARDAMLEWYKPTINELAARYGRPFDSWARMETPNWGAGETLVFHP